MRAQQYRVKTRQRRAHAHAHHQGKRNQRGLAGVLLDPFARFQDAGAWRLLKLALLSRRCRKTARRDRSKLFASSNTSPAFLPLAYRHPRPLANDLAGLFGAAHRFASRSPRRVANVAVFSQTLGLNPQLSGPGLDGLRPRV